MADPADYSNWSAEQLIDRVTSLEQLLQKQTIRNKSPLSSTSSLSLPSEKPPKPKKLRKHRSFDPTKYSTRFIALKFAYLGQRYNGLEYHANSITPLPTVEEELWKALNKARLIFPTPITPLRDRDISWEGCDYSKCGRTDRGVSAFGQVVALKVRSNRPLHLGRDNALTTAVDDAYNNKMLSKNGEMALPHSSPADDGTASIASAATNNSEAPSFHPIRDEIPYVSVLNHLLPPDIRVLAWCANPPPEFSARFSCKERRYRYFFTQPAFTPTCGAAGIVPNRQREGWLDIEAMREGAKKFRGLHDFRNFCKVDPSKQIENFERRIFYSDIEEVEPGIRYLGLSGFQEHKKSSPLGSPTSPSDQSIEPKIFAFTLHGSAFLWHQVRHMIAVLFLVGQGLESPNLVSELLDIRKNPKKPMYEMAEDAPLVLWDCIFPGQGKDPRKDDLEWLYVGDSTGFENSIAQAAGGKGNGKYGLGGVLDHMWKVWRQKKMEELLAGALLDVIVGQGDQTHIANQHPGKYKEAAGQPSGSQKVFMGGNSPRQVGKYVPVFQKPKMESIETLNAKYAKRMGFETDPKTKEAGFRSVLHHLGDGHS
ncbi:hypothetical protein MMC07_000663 [Pseudocyphellaria aurata]|nr:hypothetical protein [Pseudocyphellaria aurata]